jgi:SAM-dependent methyltransferase
VAFESKDLCIGFFADVWNAGHIVFPDKARILEIGCAEADWQSPMLALRPDLEIVGVDVRACSRPGELIQADVLTLEFPKQSCDAIVSVSAIEHIGLGAYDDPLDEHGDSETMRLIGTWLKPGGLCYLDVPYRPHGPYQNTGKHRAYDPETLASRLLVPSGLQREYAQIFDHGSDGPYIAMVLRK